MLQCVKGLAWGCEQLEGAASGIESSISLLLNGDAYRLLGKSDFELASVFNALISIYIIVRYVIGLFRQLVQTT
jgi:hypothetical protein